MAPFPSLPEEHGRTVAEALQALRVEHLVLAIHDASQPGLPEEDAGRGSPYTEGGARFLHFVRELGFNGVQFGPQGQVSEDNPSPYDGTLFSRNILNLALAPLAEEAWGALLPRERLESLVAARPEGARVQHRYAFRAWHQALQEAWDTYQRRRPPALAERLDTFQRRHREWLEPDALYEVLCRRHQRPYWREWPDALDRRLYAPRPGEEEAALARRQALLAEHREQVEAYAFAQHLVHAQHEALRQRAAAWGLTLYGDMQIGFSPRDAWAYQGLFLPGHLMGAPPSRTNPEGQPWNYPVLHPALYAEEQQGSRPGPALAFMAARVGKLLEEFDGLRVDHPHGLVCPWVYRADAPDALRAVQGGARLFSSPDVPEHPELAAYALVAPEQLERSLPRHADGWVRELSEEQVRRYARLFDTVVAAARARGRRVEHLLCEVLSTQPYPLQRVLGLYGLGRFRVTQKADLRRPEDVYRSENARPEDWMMVGNHDTRPLWLLAEGWRRTGEARAQAEYLAWRLHPRPEGREAFARRLLEEPGLLEQAKFADLFASRARNVMVFFADLLGLTEVYNVPGTVSESNWSLRVPTEYRREYAERLGRNAALNLPLALALALRARHPEGAHAGLCTALERLAAAPRQGGAASG